MAHRTPQLAPIRTGHLTGRTVGSIRRRVGTAALAVVLTCATLPALASPTASLADWRGSYGSYGSYGSSGSSGSYGSYGSSGSGSGTYGSGSSTVDSDPATTAESAGVVLIDTALPGGTGAGTGVVLTADGQILTNYHVVEGATSIEVTVAATGRSYPAEVVGHGETADVALLQLEDASGLTPATLDDDTLAVGDDVTAVGNAGGTGSLTAADGTVTTLSASITTASEYGVAGENLRGLIETDADVVPGDSGGPLVDDEGEVVGIDTAASSGGEIDGYAIPIDDAMLVITAIRSGDEGAGVQIGTKGFLGVQVADAADGALIQGVVSGSAAASAGIAAGDVITTVNGTPVADGSDVSVALGSTDAGERVRIDWTDDTGEAQTAVVTLGANPAA